MTDHAAASSRSTGPRGTAAGGDRAPLVSALILAAFLAISFAVAALGTLATLQNVDGWYAMAEKAPWSPPNALFGPVWTFLYLAMSVAAWLVWRRRTREDVAPALRLYVIQLVLNSLWTPVFFGLYPAVGPVALWIGLGIILALDVVVVLTLIAFVRHSRLAAALLVPYVLWTLFATSLNAAVAVLNS